jgi:hypothetical protein
MGEAAPFLFQAVPQLLHHRGTANALKNAVFVRPTAQCEQQNSILAPMKRQTLTFIQPHSLKQAADRKKILGVSFGHAPRWFFARIPCPIFLPDGHCVGQTCPGTPPRGHSLNRMALGTPPRGHLLGKMAPGTSPRGHSLNKMALGTSPKGHLLNKMAPGTRVNPQFFIH